MLTEFLSYFGITPDKYTFLALAILIVIGFIYMRLSIGKKLGRIKENVLVVITHLSASATSRGKLDTNLIQVMSPMFITPQGQALLESTGFKGIIDNPVHCAEIMNFVHEQTPKTKLDVETFSIISFSTLLEREFMNPIKTYLYNNPDMRDTFKTLAGLYIRDKYLAEHPEITQ